MSQISTPKHNWNDGSEIDDDGEEEDYDWYRMISWQLLMDVLKPCGFPMTSWVCQIDLEGMGEPVQLCELCDLGRWLVPHVHWGTK